MRVFVDQAIRSRIAYVLVLRDESGGAAVLDLEECGVRVGVKQLALLRSVDLLLQHPVAAVGYRILQDLVLLWSLADRRVQQLLYDVYVVYLVDGARVLYRGPHLEVASGSRRSRGCIFC